jgi:hypothetical protein
MEVVLEIRELFLKEMNLKTLEEHQLLDLANMLFL